MRQVWLEWRRSGRNDARGRYWILLPVKTEAWLCLVAQAFNVCCLANIGRETSQVQGWSGLQREFKDTMEYQWGQLQIQSEKRTETTGLPRVCITSSFNPQYRENNHHWASLGGLGNHWNVPIEGASLKMNPWQELRICPRRQVEETGGRFRSLF